MENPMVNTTDNPIHAYITMLDTTVVGHMKRYQANTILSYSSFLGRFDRWLFEHHGFRVTPGEAHHLTHEIIQLSTITCSRRNAPSRQSPTTSPSSRASSPICWTFI